MSNIPNFCFVIRVHQDYPHMITSLYIQWLICATRVNTQTDNTISWAKTSSWHMGGLLCGDSLKEIFWEGWLFHGEMFWENIQVGELSGLKFPFFGGDLLTPRDFHRGMSSGSVRGVHIPYRITSFYVPSWLTHTHTLRHKHKTASNHLYY